MAVYRWLLRLFPRAFRERFGQDVAEVFGDRLDAARREGRVAVVSLWVRTVADVLTQAVAERRADRGVLSAVRRTPRRRAVGLAQDLRYALRSFAHRPGGTAVAVLSLALGLAAAATVTSLLDAFGFRPLPVADASGLLEVRSIVGHRPAAGLSWRDFTMLRDRSRTLGPLAAYATKGVSVTGPEAAPEVLFMNVVSAGYLRTLGVHPTVGRDFSPADETAGAPRWP